MLRRKYFALGAAALVVMLGVPVFGFLGVGDVVYDPINHAENIVQSGAMIAAAASLATQTVLTGKIASSVGAIEQWGSQLALTKIPWLTKFPVLIPNSSPQNTMGEMATWGTTLATGTLAGTSWQNARASLMNIAVLKLQMQLQQWGALAGQKSLGTPALLAQLATVEALDAAGENNLRVIGNARGYLGESVPSMQHLSDMIMSLRREDNGPTQQLQYVAATQNQAASTGVQSLQVNTGILETVTGMAKTVSDATTADLNMQAQQQQTVLTESTGIRGMGAAFSSYH